MKTYFRLLSFAKPIEKYAIPYIIYTIFGVIFSTLNLALLAPLLTTLFNNSPTGEAITKPENWLNLIKTFNYYAYLANVKYGASGALKFVCSIIH